MSNLRYSNVCFTINNPTSADDEGIERLKAACDYLIIGREHLDDDDATPHYQGYFELHGQKSLRQLKTFLPRAHIEKRKGTALQASNYCIKEDQDPLLYGTISAPGKRSDVETLATLVTSGATNADLARDVPTMVIRFARGIEHLRSSLQVPRDPSTPKEVVVLYGASGTMKTRTAIETLPGAYLWGSEQCKWFDGYDGHKHVILDEFRGEASLPFAFLLRLLDRYPMKVEIKGGMREFIADVIYITSPLHPREWFKVVKLRDGSYEQLTRRITEIREMVHIPPELLGGGIVLPTTS